MRHSLKLMEDPHPSAWKDLRFPWQRTELLGYLEELSSRDPLQQWAKERREGLISGIDETIHFFFDDHDFDPSDVGVCLMDLGEVELIQAVKSALNRIIQERPNGGDAEYVGHPNWAAVQAAAKAAHRELSAR